MPLILDGTSGVTQPTWTTATRPSSPSAGQMGFNSTTSTMEIYTGTKWTVVGDVTTGKSIAMSIIFGGQ